MILIDDANKIRKEFIEKFTIPWDEFLKMHKDWADSIAARGYTVKYEDRYLWELMDDRAISFSKALEFLRSIQGNVYCMSENESKSGCHGITIDGVKHQGGIVKMNARELADLIEYEWYEQRRLWTLGMCFASTVLPDDLYVFDASMEHLLVFTHETDYWELEEAQPMKVAESRFCMMYGFPLPEGVTYKQIQSVFQKELPANSSLEMELSYSISYYRQFILSKWTNDDNTGYEYWFDFDSDTNYSTWEEVENAKVFNDLSLKEISELDNVRFEILKIDGNDYVDYGTLIRPIGE